jgi:hypothetical protein
MHEVESEKGLHGDCNAQVVAKGRRAGSVGVAPMGSIYMWVCPYVNTLSLSCCELMKGKFTYSQAC